MRSASYRPGNDSHDQVCDGGLRGRGDGSSHQADCGSAGRAEGAARGRRSDTPIIRRGHGDWRAFARRDSPTQCARTWPRWPDGSRRSLPYSPGWPCVHRRLRDARPAARALARTPAGERRALGDLLVEPRGRERIGEGQHAHMARRLVVDDLGPEDAGGECAFLLSHQISAFCQSG
jgi:hypothetical protein